MASVVVMSIKITQNQSGFGKHITYKTILDDASGILEKTPIKVAGINAGKIQRIELLGSKALLTFEVLEHIKVTPEAKLKIKSVGLLGDKYIDMEIGKAEGERLAERSMILSRGGEGFDDILKEVKEIAGTIKEALRDDEGKNMIKEIITNIKDVTATIKRITDVNESKVNKIIDD